jgi:oxygen-independent coproporphyrinogen-3 oxidase
MGAASYINGRRFSRPKSIKKYYEYVDEGILLDNGDQESIHDKLLNTIMCQLRKVTGISWQKLT